MNIEKTSVVPTWGEVGTRWERGGNAENVALFPRSHLSARPREFSGSLQTLSILSRNSGNSGNKASVEGVCGVPTSFPPGMRSGNERSPLFLAVPRADGTLPRPLRLSGAAEAPGATGGGL